MLVTTYGYDVAGNQDTVTDPKGIVTPRNDFDDMGRVVTKVIVDYTDGTPTSERQSDDRLHLRRPGRHYQHDGSNAQLEPPTRRPRITSYGVSTSGWNKLNSADLLSKSNTLIQKPAVQPRRFAHSPDLPVRCTDRETISMIDQNGTTHVYAYDTAGRGTSDTVTVASGIPEYVDADGHQAGLQLQQPGPPCRISRPATTAPAA